MAKSTEQMKDYGFSLFFLLFFAGIGYFLAWATSTLESFDLPSYWMGIVIGFLATIPFAVGYARTRHKDFLPE